MGYRIVRFIAGSEDQFSLRHRILNLSGFFGMMVFFQAIIVNLYLRLPWPAVGTSVFSFVVVTVALYKSRINRHYKLPAFMILAVLIYLAAPVLWVTNGGLEGSIPYWFIYLSISAAVLCEGKGRLVLLISTLVLVTGLSLGEHFEIYTPFPYENSTVRFWDTFPQIMLVMLLSISLIAIISESYANEHSRVKQSADTLLKVNKQMQRVIDTDFLTKLYNRAYVLDRIRYERENMIRHNRSFCLVIVDIDDFKLVNDTYGHNCGDLLLRAVAKDIKSVLRKTDTAARWGGEEFLILLPDTHLKSGERVAEKVRRKVSSAVYDYENEKLSITVSIGLSVYDDTYGKLTIDECIKMADEALYKSKELGKNQCQISELSAG